MKYLNSREAPPLLKEGFGEDSRNLSNKKALYRPIKTSRRLFNLDVALLRGHPEAGICECESNSIIELAIEPVEVISASINEVLSYG